MQQQKNNLNFLTINLERHFKNLFLPVIRSRGNKYAKQGRVEICNLKDKEIEAKVYGTYTYKIFLSLDDENPDSIRISCTCPFFKQGILCKHVWATIVTASKSAKEASKAKTKDKKKSQTSFSLDKFFELGSKGSEKKRYPWKDTQDFVLRYELRKRPFGGFHLSAFEQYVKKNGRYGRIKKLSQRLASHPDLPNIDKIILSFLKEADQRDDIMFHHFGLFKNYNEAYENLKLSNKDLGTIIPFLARTKRCIVVDEFDKVLADPLLEVDSEKAKILFETKPYKTEGKYILSPQIVLGNNEILPCNEVFFIFSEPIYIIHNSTLYELAWPTSLELVNEITKKSPPILKKKELPELFERAVSNKMMEYIKLPHEFSPRIKKDITPKPGLILDFKDGKISGELFFHYDSLKIPWPHKDEEIFDKDEWTILRRNLDEEQRFLDRLLELGFKDTPVEGLLELDLEGADKKLNTLEREGFILEATDGKPVKTGIVKGFNISSGMDWFDLKADIRFGDESVPLPRVIRAFQQGQKTIRLSSGGQGILPSKWLEKNKRLFELARIKGERGKEPTVKFPTAHALLLEELISEAEEANVDDRFNAIRQRLKNFRGIRPLRAPQGFGTTLRPYQEEALGWFEFLKGLGLGGILAHDMGLGKTVQVLALLEREKQEGARLPNLIVAPTSLVFNWQSEAERFAPKLRIIPYLGPHRKDILKKLKDGECLLTTYGILRRDILKLKDMEFNYAILDESQYIKNPESQTAKASRLIRANHRLCLTGTPIENHLGELWSQMEFLNPGLLGPKDKYLERFAKPAAQGDREVLETLKQIVAPFILRRTKEEVAKELPDKIESIVMCTMTDEQKELYQRIRDHYRLSIFKQVEAKGMGRSKMMVLEGLLRLRQVANHPALLGEKDLTSGKFSQLLELIGEAIEGGHKALIFSQFTRMLQLIKGGLEEKGISFEYLDGRTPQAKRKERVKNFQENEEVRAFLISLKAGGFGLNLTSADYVFIVDPWWNPAVELQAIDRTHRIGQTKKVVTYRLISKDTVEEKVLRLQKKKQEIVGSILSGSKDLLRNLTARDLEILFS